MTQVVKHQLNIEVGPSETISCSPFMKARRRNSFLRGLKTLLSLVVLQIFLYLIRHMCGRVDKVARRLISCTTNQAHPASIARAGTANQAVHPRGILRLVKVCIRKRSA